MPIKNTADIRSQNKKKIIAYLRQEHSTKKVLADQLALSFATVSNLCNTLIEEGILEITSSESSNGGRIPGLISARANGRYTLCLNVNNPETSMVALVNMVNQVVDDVSVPIKESGHYEDFLQTIYEEAIQLVAKHGIAKNDLLGIGAAIPGIFNRTNSCVINSTSALLENKLLKTDLERMFNLPVYLENESNLLALAALLNSQEHDKPKDIIYIYMGEGLGVGITHQGSILTGARGLGGEISHIPIGMHSFECYCGQQGCIESELTMAGFYRKRYGKDAPIPDQWSDWWEQFVEEIRIGNEQALCVVAENGKLLGKLVSVLTNIFDPDEVHVGGFVEKLFPYLHPFVLEEAQGRIVTQQHHMPRILNSIGYEKLLIKGCSEIVFKQWSP